MLAALNSQSWAATATPHIIPGSKTDQLYPQDLGTTYSCVGVMKKGNVEILVNDQGMPSPFLLPLCHPFCGIMC